ncbi:c-type cytochrome [Mucilaginibacter limnophilus]|uniref:C-type cytochrome n=1 Tax=Mucilaginibacter limnophilus TaxID=1932778 RepID=A0A3S2V2C5_9SPHI|nr:c-type cytochrome [Mucilaginibacter limnophilus]RVU01410.1 c-type cytochrome [Mucilaginibacter limnophilus]
MKKKTLWLTGVVCLSLSVYTCSVSKKTLPRDVSGRIILDTTPNRGPLSPQEAIKTIHVQPGYHLELVASEPMVQEPVAIAWDGNARLYVAELNTYMQDVDGTNENKPWSRIKRLEDTNGDGKMDKATVFIDSLLLPRMILPLDNRLLVSETYSADIYSYDDTNGDGKADTKKLVYKDPATQPDTRNLEHQRSGLVWNLDNRIYITVDPLRYKFNGTQLIAEKMNEGPGGQWGLANDNYGRLYFSSAGGETPALNFQQNPSYGYFNLDNQINDEFQAVWPIITTPDVQGGAPRLRPDSTLNHFTACTGQSIYRGDKLPADLQGDLLICEPVGRLIRRAKVINNQGKISLVNAYNKEEFIASTDMNFRPVNTVTGPDGCLYIVDMYHGIIQEGNWTQEGSYLRPQIVSKGLDKNINRGRIYRLVADNVKPSKVRPQLLKASSAELVGYLSHPNGWWRDNAQKFLVLRKDKSVVPALWALAQKGQPLARIHALWTLQGMDALTKPQLFDALKDADAKVRKTAVWIAEDFIQNDDADVLNRLDVLRNDTDPEVRFQLALTLRFNKTQKAKDIINYLVSNYDSNSILALSQKRYENMLAEREASRLKALAMQEEDRKLVNDGATIFKQLCATCHGADGKGINNGGKDMPAPPLANNSDVNGNPEKLIKILLHGLKGPVNGKTYPDVMPALGFNDDRYIASVLSYVRTNMGNSAKTVRPEWVKRVREQNAGRTTNWTMEELNKAK